MNKCSITELLPLPEDAVATVYDTAASTVGSLIPHVPAIGLAVRMMVSSQETRNLTRKGADLTFYEEEFTPKGDDVFLNHLVTAPPEVQDRLAGGLGTSIIVGLAAERAGMAGCNLALSPTAGLDQVDSFLTGAEGDSDDPPAHIFPYLDTRLAIDSRRIAEGLGARIDTILCRDEPGQTAQHIGEGMLLGYWQAGGS